METLSGKVALITGAANGQGAAAAELFAKEGAAVVLFDRDAEGLERVEKAIEAAISDSTRTLAVTGDVTDENSLRRAVDESLSQFDQLDVLYNNAGIDLRGHGDGRIDDMDTAALVRTMEVNLYGVINGCRAVIPHMVSRGTGSIISTSSVGGVIGVDLLGYSASKGGVISFARSLGTTYGRRGIRSNVICPGLVRTELIREILDDEKYLKAVQKATPLGRLAEPDEIAKVALFLASDWSSYVNAATIMVDGGLTAR